MKVNYETVMQKIAMWDGKITLPINSTPRKIEFVDSLLRIHYTFQSEKGRDRWAPLSLESYEFILVAEDEDYEIAYGFDFLNIAQVRTGHDSKFADNYAVFWRVAPAKSENEVK